MFYGEKGIKIIVINKALKDLTFNSVLEMDCFLEIRGIKYGLRHLDQALNIFQTRTYLDCSLKKIANQFW